jgi:branched-chain amino acid transport system substrate-binding protein
MQSNRIFSIGLLGLGLLALGAAGCKPPEPTETTTGGTSTTGTTSGTTEPPVTGKRPAPTNPGPTVEGDTIKIGLVASQNGELKPWGADSIQGAKLAEEEINAAGGINGKKVLIIVGDTQSKAEVGKTAAEKLVEQDKVVGMLGEVASGITMPVADVCYNAGIPLVVIGATKPEISDTGTNIFRVCYTDNFQGPVMAKFAYEKLGLKKIAVMTDNKQPYSQFLSKSFSDYFTKLGGTIVGEENYESGATQFSGQLTAIKALNPDGMFLSGYFTEVGPIAKQANQMGMKGVKFLGGDGWDSSQLLTSGGEAILGSYFCNHYNNEEPRPEVKNFLDRWKKKYNNVPGTTMAALGYDAAMLMFDALKRSPGLSAKETIDALENTEGFAGVSGSITLKGKKGDPDKRALVVEVTKNGQKFAQAYDPSDIK